MHFKSIISCLIILSTPLAIFSQGATCGTMEEMCLDYGTYYTGVVGEVAGPGNDYDCLGSQPNPAWYYLEIDDPGDIEMELFADSDIDFIIWGPFDNLDIAIETCGDLGGSIESPVVDCSYSGVAYETPEITSALSGEIYVLLITNYAAVVQEITVNKLTGEGSTVCPYVPGMCESYSGTFTGEKNDAPFSLDEEIVLYLGDSFSAISNEDYILPNDTIPLPYGDGIYSAQIMWLVYEEAPVGTEPLLDPGYLGYIVPNEDLYEVNDVDSEIIEAFGYGTYYFVHVAGDDGVGGNGNVANGIDDNGALHWDKNNNGCYELGTPIMVTYLDLDVTSIDEINNTNISAFPNPAESSLFIEFDNLKAEKHEVVIYNLLGEMVYNEGVIGEGTVEIKMETIDAGCYIISVLNSNLEQVYHSKFIVKK